MRKSIFAIMGILLIFTAVACTQNPVDLPDQKPGGEGELGTWDINNTEDLQRFFSLDGTATARMNLTVDPASNMFPMTIVGNKTFSGDIRVGGASGASYASNITPPQSGAARVADGKQLFVVANGASVTLTNLDVTVSEEAAVQISAVVAVNNSTITTDNYNVTVSGTSTGSVTGIAIGADTVAENITISNSKPGNIYVSPDNEADSDIQKEIIADNPELVVETKYDAADAESLLNALVTYNHAILTEDITLTAGILNEKKILVAHDGSDRAYFYLNNGANTINLNGHTLTSEVGWYLPTANSEIHNELTVSNGTLCMNNYPTWSKLNGSIQLFTNTALTFNDVEFTSDITGIFIADQNHDIDVNIFDSTLDIEGYFGIGTNATKIESYNIDLNISGSEITTADAEGTGNDNTAILFNVQGEVTISDSIVTGDSQAMIVRGGKHTFNNVTFIAKGTHSTWVDYSSQNWSSGNAVPLAALVIGNRSNSYPYGSTVTMTNVTVEAPAQSYFDTPVEYYGVYIWQNKAEEPVVVNGTLNEGAGSEAATFINTEMNGADITGLTINEQ